jgi:hypothetical protein
VQAAQAELVQAAQAVLVQLRRPLVQAQSVVEVAALEIIHWQPQVVQEEVVAALVL